MDIDRNPKILFWLILMLVTLFSGGYILSRLLDGTSHELVINEIMAANSSGLIDEDGDHSDWIEIYNESNYSVNLASWTLTNDPKQPQKWPFPNKTLRPHEYLIVFASGKDRRGVEPGQLLHTNFRLNKTGDYLALYQRFDGRFEAVIPAGQAQFNDIAYGRYGKGTEYGYLATATPGQANAKLLAQADAIAPTSLNGEVPDNLAAPTEAAPTVPDNLLAWQPAQNIPVGNTQGSQQTIDDGFWSILGSSQEDQVKSSQLYITEIMYNPLEGEAYEFLRLTNMSDRPVNLAGAVFDEGINFTFPVSTPPLAPGGSMILVHDKAAFAAQYPGEMIGGVYHGQLSNDGEKITLKDIAGQVLASVVYDDEAGWPLTPDGRGDALVLINEKGDLSSPINWRASSQVPAGVTFLEP